MSNPDPAVRNIAPIPTPVPHKSRPKLLGIILTPEFWAWVGITVVVLSITTTAVLLAAAVATILHTLGG